MDFPRSWEYIRPTLGNPYGESEMNFKVLCSCALFVLAIAVTPAQTKMSTSGKCGKPDTAQSVTAADKDGHVFMIASGKCETAGKVAGATSKEAAFAEHSEVTGDHMRTWGVFAETFDSGDKIFYDYESNATVKDGKLESGADKWRITGGTGKMKGMKGSGTCKLAPGTHEGGLDYACTGTYTHGEKAAAKKP
jgi:hypothetical protein